MKPLKKATVLFFCTILFAHLGCDSAEQAGKADVSLTKETALQPQSVSVTEVTRHDFSRTVQFTGTLQAKNHVGLRALVEGIIEKLEEVEESEKAILVLAHIVSSLRVCVRNELEFWCES